MDPAVIAVRHISTQVTPEVFDRLKAASVNYSDLCEPPLACRELLRYTTEPYGSVYDYPT
jgi:hypothetical protein